MSLVNKMLKDLETHRRSMKDRSASVLSTLQPVKEERCLDFHPAWLLLIAAVIVALCALFFSSSVSPLKTVLKKNTPAPNILKKQKVTVPALVTRPKKNAAAPSEEPSLAVKTAVPQSAMHILHDGLVMMPGYAPFNALEAHALAGQGKTAQAIALLNDAHPDIHSQPDYYAFLAALYQRNKQYMMSAQIYNQLVKTNPSQGVWWMGLGIAFQASEKNNAALEAFQKSLTASGLSPNLQAYIQQQIQRLS
jgi:tetratricopeptide (TPR) repeat protein